MISLSENHEGKSHARILTGLIDQTLSDAQAGLSDLSAIAVSKGPGSFTGLRIGVSTAKGLCYALNIPMISVNTLFAMAHSFHLQHKVLEGEYLLPMIDARRREVYMAVFDHQLKEIIPTSAVILDSEEFEKITSGRSVIIFGDATHKASEIITGQIDIKFYPTFGNSARGMIIPAFEAFQNGIFENSAYFEPYYLKDFYSPVQQGK
jgi:tRNA threonylcarbamoyladenosine biosynthesis protein TsaB